MSYMVLNSGECIGSNPAGSAGVNDGGLKMVWELRFYTSAETPTIMNKTYSCPAGSYRLYYRLRGWYGIQISGNIRLTNRTGSAYAAYVQFRNGATPLWEMGTQDHTYASRNPHFGNNNPPNAWYDVADATYSDAYRVYPEGLISVSQGATLSLNLTYYLGLYYNSSYKANVSATSASTTVVVTGGQSAISSLPASAATLDTVTLGVTRYNAAYWHKATFKVGNTTLHTSAAFETSCSVTIPRAWFSSFPSSASLTVTVSMQTYSDQSCTTTVGSPDTRTMTVTADAGMAPSIGSGFAAAAAYNTGTAAASITGYVQGYSKARLTLDKSKLTMAVNATVASYTVSCQGSTTQVSAPGASATVDTGVLAGSGDVTITVTVTDSRGRTASTSLTISVMAYAPPTLSEIDVFRCDVLGAADDDGTYVSVKATGGVSGLNGQNALTLTAKFAVGSGGYGTASALTSGAVSVLGGTIDPDQRLYVLISATDTLGNEGTALRSFPTRAWAMKIRADGQGVAFGKAPEYGQKKMELPADWTLMFGAETWLNKVWPVGSIYMSVNITDPGTLFGGTWQRIQDTFLLAAGTNYAAGTTGGEESHTLLESEMPSHAHSFGAATTAGESSGFGLTQIAAFVDRVMVSGHNTNTGNAGGGAAHNNMPPYLAVYVWQRTA